MTNRSRREAVQRGGLQEEGEVFRRGQRRAAGPGRAGVSQGERWVDPDPDRGGVGGRGDRARVWCGSGGLRGGGWAGLAGCGQLGRGPVGVSVFILILLCFLFLF